jgi:hypothetical protein
MSHTDIARAGGLANTMGFLVALEAAAAKLSTAHTNYPVATKAPLPRGC